MQRLPSPLAWTLAGAGIVAVGLAVATASPHVASHFLTAADTLRWGTGLAAALGGLGAALALALSPRDLGITLQHRGLRIGDERWSGTAFRDCWTARDRWGWWRLHLRGDAARWTSPPLWVDPEALAQLAARIQSHLPDDAEAEAETGARLRLQACADASYWSASACITSVRVTT